MDLPPQVENVSGHHALVSHVDACFGLEREGNDLIAFGGVARNSVTSTQMLEEDLESLRFEVANGEQAAKTVMTMKDREFWGIAKEMRHFTFTELREKAATKNKKALAAMLRKAEEHRILSRNDASYVVVVPDSGISGTAHDVNKLLRNLKGNNLETSETAPQA